MSTGSWLLYWLVWTLAMLYSSWQLWTKPREWQRKRSIKRAKLRQSWLRFLNLGSRIYDENPKREVLESKIAFGLLYLSQVDVFVLIVTGHANDFLR